MFVGIPLEYPYCSPHKAVGKAYYDKACNKVGHCARYNWDFSTLSRSGRTKNVLNYIRDKNNNVNLFLSHRIKNILEAKKQCL